MSRKWQQVSTTDHTSKWVAEEKRRGTTKQINHAKVGGMGIFERRRRLKNLEYVKQFERVDNKWSESEPDQHFGVLKQTKL